MKNEKANWFVRNSNWLFWITLIPAVVLVNLGFVRIKMLVKFGFIASYFWTLLIILVLLIATIAFLYFIIYLFDDIEGNLRRRVLLFDRCVLRWHLKE